MPALEHLAKGRLLLAFSHRVHGFIHLDGGGLSGGLDAADQVSTEAHARLEEVGVANLPRSLGQR